MEALRVFVGSDPREQIGLHVFLESLWTHAKGAVSVTVLTPQIGKAYGIGTDGTNAFTKLRFLVPYLCGYKGHAIFMDGADMLLRADVQDLWGYRNWRYGVQVVKHYYRTKHQRKYIGTSLEADNADYDRKNWSSVILFSNDQNWNLTPEFVAKQPGSYLHRFSWLPEDKIGSLPAEWNHIPGELDPNKDAKLVHFSLGIPGFEHYRHDEHAREWQETLKRCAQGLQYLGR